MKILKTFLTLFIMFIEQFPAMVYGKPIFSVNVTRSAAGDFFEPTGFDLQCKQKYCTCGTHETLLLEPADDDESRPSIACVHSFVKGEHFSLENEETVPTVIYKNQTWSVPGSGFLSHSLNIHEKLKCWKNLNLLGVFVMRYFSFEQIKNHHITVDVLNDSTTKIAISGNATKEQYEGELLFLRLYCDKEESFLAMKFEGQRSVVGNFNPLTFTFPTTKSPTVVQKTPSSGSSHGTSVIIAITVGCVGVLLIILALSMFICFFRRSKTNIITKQESHHERTFSDPPEYPGPMIPTYPPSSMTSRYHVPPTYDVPLSLPLALTFSHDSVAGIPRRKRTPLPPTPDDVSSSSETDSKYEDPYEIADEDYESMYLRMLSAAECLRIYEDDNIEKNTESEDDESVSNEHKEVEIMRSNIKLSSCGSMEQSDNATEKTDDTSSLQDETMFKRRRKPTLPSKAVPNGLLLPEVTRSKEKMNGDEEEHEHAEGRACDEVTNTESDESDKTEEKILL